ncbi:MAG TPA: 50S ribosomal protein L5 [Candidatus Paceibacterota bacterium]|nr:50S ribosomal protein L5 [Candidatus Paceibacterota bacterium]
MITHDKQQGMMAALKERFGYTNPMQTPKVTKIVLSTGVGSIADKNKRELIFKRLTAIAGQKPKETQTRKSIATFKTREGDLSGYQVTLRGARMYSFLDKLIHVVLPRTRDFRGLSATGIDEMGNYTFGIREHTVFPETADEDIRDIFGLAITIVTTAKSKDEAEALLRELGLPLQQQA